MRFNLLAKALQLLLMGSLALSAGFGQSYSTNSNGNIVPARQPQKSAPPTGQPRRQSTPAISYTPWNDPAESAFSVSLPRGWQVTGGTQRTTRIEPHYVVHAQSPSGGVQMFMDDPRIAIRQVPNAIASREGTAIPSAWGGKLLVQRYRPAPQAAQEYVQRIYCSAATDFHGGIIPGQTQDLNNQFGPIARAEGKQIHVDVGELSFKCGDRIGYIYAITLQAWQQGGPVSLWLIYRIAGYLATPAESAQAAAAMHTMLGSFQMNEQWLQRFARECNDTAGNVIRESNAVTQSTIARAKQQDAESQSRFESWKVNSDANFNAIQKTSRAITGAGSYSGGGGNGNGHDYNAQLGTKHVCDDVGHCSNVDASVTNWYADCSGTFYPGSESGSSPSSSTSACWSKGH